MTVASWSLHNVVLFCSGCLCLVVLIVIDVNAVYHKLAGLICRPSQYTQIEYKAVLGLVHKLGGVDLDLICAVMHLTAELQRLGSHRFHLDCMTGSRVS